MRNYVTHVPPKSLSGWFGLFYVPMRLFLERVGWFMDGHR